MACNMLLPERFIQGDGACHGNIQGLYDAHLRDYEITIGQRPAFFRDTGMFIPKHQGRAARKIHLMETYGIRRQVRGIYFFKSLPEHLETGFEVLKLMHGKPFVGTAAASWPPFLMAGYAGIHHKNVLHPNGIAGAHDR